MIKVRRYLLNDIEKEELHSSLTETVLSDILNLHMQLNNTCDKKANFTLGIAGIILIITLTKMVDIFDPTLDYNILVKIVLIITIFTSLLAAILSVFSIKPKIEDKDRLNLFYYGSFCNMITRDEYESEIKNLLTDKEKIIKQYSDEIYDLGKHDLMPRFENIKWATRILIISLIFGIGTIILYILL